MQFLRDIRSLNDLIKKIKEYQNYLLLAIGITTAVVGGVYGYLYYKQSKEEGAYRSFVLALEYFDAPIKKEDEKKEEEILIGIKEFSSKQEKWEKVDTVFKKGYDEHSSAGIASLFLVYRSEALVKLGKLDDAVKILRSAIASMSNAKMKDYFMVKLALMLFDQKKESEGLDLLKELALKEDSIAHENTLYHLGEYFWYKKQFVEARNYWNQFLVKYGKSDKYISPLVPRVKDKLKLIDSDVE